LRFDELAETARALLRYGPVPIVFADRSFAFLIDNWLEHARRAGVKHVLLVALDDTVMAHAETPECRRVQLPFTGDLAELWLLRLLVFERLAREGIDFVHSDLDAVWLGDPRAECFADPALDLVFSQGTFYPDQAHAAWGFVLCCGLFAARGRSAAARFFAAAHERAAIERDDQIAVNLLLLESGIEWRRSGQEPYELRVGDRRISCFRQMVSGFSEAAGLAVGMLPFHCVPRLPIGFPGAVVKHPFSLRSPASKIAALKRDGVWLMAPN